MTQKSQDLMPNRSYNYRLSKQTFQPLLHLRIRMDLKELGFEDDAIDFIIYNSACMVERSYTTDVLDYEDWHKRAKSAENKTKSAENNLFHFFKANSVMPDINGPKTDPIDERPETDPIDERLETDPIDQSNNQSMKYKASNLTNRNDSTVGMIFLQYGNGQKDVEVTIDDQGILICSDQSNRTPLNYIDNQQQSWTPMSS